jgi:hypothetical protein
MSCLVCTCLTRETATDRQNDKIVVANFNNGFMWTVEMELNITVIWDTHNLFKGEAYLMIMTIKRKAWEANAS